MGIEDPAKIMILEMGSAAASMVKKYGDFGQWFLDIMVTFSPEPECDVVPVSAYTPELYKKYDGMILTGALEHVYFDLPFKELLKSDFDKMIAGNFPVLAVCFGHQLFGYFAGAEVIRNPKGLEIGSAEIMLTEEGKKDPLYEGINTPGIFYESHNDVLISLPDNFRILAYNDFTDIQSLALSPNIRTVQFHPEVTYDIAQDFIHEAGEQLSEEESRKFISENMEKLEKSEAGVNILKNFYKNFVLNK